MHDDTQTSSTPRLAGSNPNRNPVRTRWNGWDVNLAAALNSAASQKTEQGERAMTQAMRRRYHQPTPKRRPLFRAGWVGWCDFSDKRMRCGWVDTARGGRQRADRDAQSGKCVVLRGTLGTGNGNRGNLPGGRDLGREARTGRGAQFQPCSSYGLE